MRTVSLQLAEDTVAGVGVPDDENGAIKRALGYLWQFVAQYPQPASLLNPTTALALPERPTKTGFLCSLHRRPSVL